MATDEVSMKVALIEEAGRGGSLGDRCSAGDELASVLNTQLCLVRMRWDSDEPLESVEESRLWQPALFGQSVERERFVVEVVDHLLRATHPLTIG
jgi:hypothetical protein